MSAPAGVVCVAEICWFRRGAGSALCALVKTSIQAATASGTGARPSIQRVASVREQPSSCARSPASHRKLLRHSRKRPAIMAIAIPFAQIPSRHSWTAPAVAGADFAQLRADVSVDDTCCAARNISVE
ncbi:hypothetical protein, partial [Mesorhizobium sp. M2A.F.Ca.ET.039.01.1.1]|uniref:hypothetical protein n=1 Tax=Mesorhizobium sp. M2A.F.Ca.ET.039.01.1.1 TaxID=2496746 RepID=UPI001AED02D9